MFSRRDILKYGILSIFSQVKLSNISDKERLYFEIENAVLTKIKLNKPITKMSDFGFWLDPHIFREGKIGWCGFFRFNVPLEIKLKQIDYDKKFEGLKDYDVQKYLDNRPEYNCERVAICFDYTIEEFYEIIKHKTNKPYYEEFKQIGCDFAYYCTKRLREKLILENLLDA